jgi:tRNA (cytidine32/uridine32-2'-O)-methyltransferase
MSHGVWMMKKRTAENTRSGPRPPQQEPVLSQNGPQNESPETRDLLGRIRVVLINTTHPGNIGATARAMKVMGLSRLHLVTPKKFPDADATALASGADDLLQHAQVHGSLESALENCGLVLGTSARIRSLAMPQFNARTAAQQAIAEAGKHEVALLFGRERYGLTNEEMQRCHWLVHIDANPDYASLNLAQAVQVLSYELRMAALGEGHDRSGLAGELERDPVDGVQMERFFEHLEQTLLEIQFLNPAQPRKLMMRLRRLFNRARPDQNEINILRGILTAAGAHKRGPQSPA